MEGRATMGDADWAASSKPPPSQMKLRRGAERPRSRSEKPRARRSLIPSLTRHRSEQVRRPNHVVELSPMRRREIIAQVNASVQSVMMSMLTDSPDSVQWRPKLRKKDISYYVDETSVQPGQTRFCCVSHTTASVEEVMRLFTMTDSESLLRNNRVLYDNLLETKILTVLRRPTLERPMSSMYVRYASFQSPGLLTDRDMCVATATDVLHQPDGSTVGYCLWDSVDDPEFAMAAKTPGVIPCTMFRSGFFIRRSGRRPSPGDDPTRGMTKIVYMVGMEPGGWAPGLTSRLMMERYGASLTRLVSHFRRKHLDSRAFVMKAEWVPKGSVNNCKRCDAAFHVLSKRVNCHACGQVVCKACSSKESVELHAVGLVPMPICFTCLEKAGLSVPSSQSRSSNRRRFHSDTATASRTARQAQSPQRPVADANLNDEDDDEDSDEWAFTPSGVPVRPYRPTNSLAESQRVLGETRRLFAETKRDFGETRRTIRLT